MVDAKNEGGHTIWMILQMDDSRLRTLDQIKAFLGSNQFDFRIKIKSEAYQWVNDRLIQFKYRTLRKTDKAVLKQYLQAITGYSRSQITRLIRKYVKSGKVQVTKYKRHQPNMQYQEEDIKLLATTDELHNFPGGQSLKTTLTRLYKVFNKKEYRNISRISVSHIYNLRDTPEYKRITKNYDKTKPHIIAIGERIRPDPQGRPGYIRVDTVHQGDKDGEKGVYHINTVDEVTQFEVIGSVEKISEAFLIPLVEYLLDQYPYYIIEFHADNGGEFINHELCKLLNKIKIRLTKSRPRKSNDNALVEGKNGWIIRKFMGYVHIKQRWAAEINTFYNQYFNHYINYHRPCAFPSETIDKKGKIKKLYKLDDYQTPYEKLKSLENAQQYLKPGITFELLDQEAYRFDDNEFAGMMQKARKELFQKILVPDLHIIKL